MRLGGWLQSAPLYIPRRNRLKAILKAQDRSEVAKKDAPEVPADNFTLNTQLVKGDEDPVASAITSLSRYQKSRCQPEHQNWDSTKWHGCIRGAATKAAAELSHSHCGPDGAERFLTAILDQGILPLTECGPVVGAVLSGFSRNKNAHKVIHAASNYFADGRVVPSSRSLVVILNSCQMLGSQDLLNEAWDNMVIPTLRKRQMSAVPRAVSSSYLRASFIFDMESHIGKGLEDCLKGEGNVPRAVESIWTVERQRLVGPLLTTSDLMALSQQVRDLADLWLLLNSSLGRRREKTTESVLGYRPNLSALDMIWEGESSAPRVWGAPLASRIISVAIKMGLNQFAMEVVAASISEGRIHMPVNALLNAASLTGNFRMAVSASEILHQHKALPRSRSGRSFLRLLADTPPPWGYKGDETFQTQMQAGNDISKLSTHNWISMIDCLLRAGGSLQQIITLVETALLHNTSRLHPGEDSIDMIRKAKILGAAMQALSGRVGYEEKRKYIEFFLQVGTKAIGSSLDDNRRDHLVSRALSSLIDGRVDHALTKGGPCMDAAGINLNEVLNFIERSKGISRLRAAEMLAPELRQIILRQGLIAVKEIMTGKASDLLKVVVSNHV